jgi:hypothetical protein
MSMAVEFRWQEGERRAELVSPPPRKRRNLRRPLMIVATVLLLVLVAGGLILWNRARHGLRAAQADLQAVVDAEVTALQRGDEDVYLSMQDYRDRQWYRFQQLYFDALQRTGDSSAPEQLGGLQVVDLDLRDDLAWVEVEYSWREAMHRRVQFYRLTGGHWRRTSPDVRYWGGREESATQSVRYVYHEREEEIIASVSDQVEQLFQQAQRDFGLSPPVPQITFEFRPVAESMPALYSQGHFLVPSPLLLGVRADGAADADLLASLGRSVVLYLAMERSGLYVREAGPGSSWLMLNGVVAWELDEWRPGSALPASWYLWLQEAASSDSLPPVASLWPPLRLDTDRDGGIAYAQAKSVVAYAVELGGRGTLPVLLDALGSKMTAAETVQSALGIDLATLEVGWKRFVQQSLAR